MKSPPIENPPGRRLLTEPTAAWRLGVSPTSLRTARCRGVGELATLPHVKIGRLVRYDERDLDNWIESRRRAEWAP